MAEKTSLVLSTEIDSTLASLYMVNGARSLKVDKIRLSIDDILLSLCDLQFILDEMETDAKRHKIRQFGKAPIDWDDQVNGSLSLLADSRNSLHSHVLTINVGLTGNLEGGFRVARDELQRVNATVLKLCGQQLILAEKLECRWPVLKQDAETEEFLLEPEDISALGLTSSDEGLYRVKYTGLVLEQDEAWRLNTDHEFWEWGP
ncbi:unnamed protein product [Clonostachys rosea]|uniref:Uncharacterized protein n=1 Tax=Bionectria ochroleuca TaxID=29856 RepID=A0ABY6TU32_BIOOC|nr:unnamed protein product [Clonostachys rosea]